MSPLGLDDTIDDIVGVEHTVEYRDKRGGTVVRLQLARHFVDRFCKALYVAGSDTSDRYPTILGCIDRVLAHRLAWQ